MSIPELDITITACRRPEVLATTLASFRKYLIPDGVNCRVIINVDPVGHDVSNQAMIDVVREHFSTVLYQFPARPHFGKAFKWAWSQVEAPFVLHLEDDWELLRPVPYFQLMRLFWQYKDLMSLRLSAFHTTLETTKNWNKFLRWTGDFFEPPQEEKGLLAFCGHPSIIRKEFIQQVLPHINENGNPEKQIKGRNKAIASLLVEKRYGVWSDRPAPPLVRDLGRAWMVQNGFAKFGAKAVFTRWEKI